MNKKSKNIYYFNVNLVFFLYFYNYFFEIIYLYSNYYYFTDNKTMIQYINYKTID
jgi:hypothetical protein